MRWKTYIICLLLGGLTLSLYWPATHFDLIYFDDPLFVSGYPGINSGWNWHSLAWAFTGVVAANWHPLTNLTFLLTHQFYGPNPGVEHLVNAALHCANAVLVFLLFQRLTKTLWRSALIAALFAWHPQRVESVAWIAERKDVLCAFFFLLTLCLYARFNEATPAQRPKAKVFYGASLATFALALLSKPMAVTLPFVLLLLDVWPLQRFSVSRFKFQVFKQLLREKIPFFALMFFFCGLTYWVQRNYAAMTPWDQLGLDARVANAIASYLNYPAQLFWPTHFAAIYPFPKDYDAIQTALKAALLLVISYGCWQQLARRPWLAVGWCWYLGTAVPIIGIVQVGEQAMADRYTYLPLIGPVAALVWLAAEFSPNTRRGKIFLTITAAFILSTLVILTARQLQFWRNTIELFSHNLAITPENGSAAFTLGLGFEHTNDLRRALVCYRVAKQLSPSDLQPRLSLATLFAKENHLAEAEAEYAGALALQPGNFEIHAGLASVLAMQGRVEEEFFQLNEAVRLNPDSAEALNNLAWELATNPRADLRDGPRAVQLAQHACAITGFQKTMFLGTLAAALAETGKFDDAIATAQQACDLAAKNGESNLLQKNQELLARYREHKTARAD